MQRLKKMVGELKNETNLSPKNENYIIYAVELSA